MAIELIQWLGVPTVVAESLSLVPGTCVQHLRTPIQGCLWVLVSLGTCTHEQIPTYRHTDSQLQLIK